MQIPAENMQPTYTLRELAGKVGVPELTVAAWVFAGCPFTRIDGVMYFDPQLVERWFHRNDPFTFENMGRWHGCWFPWLDREPPRIKRA